MLYTLVILLCIGFLVSITVVPRPTAKRWGIIAILLLLIIGLSTLSMPGPRIIRTKKTECLHNAKTIALACKLYAADHDGNYPVLLDILIPEYLPNRNVFSCPFAPDKNVPGYDYFGGKDTDSPDKILIRAKYADDGKRTVVYSDGSGAVVKDSVR